MRWEKQGLLFAPNNNFPWMATHAANPFAENIDKDLFRVYFTCRDSENRSHIAWVDVDLATRKIENMATVPILSPGKRGTFDDSGAALGWIIEINGQKLFYYLGWNLAVTVPWRNSIGLAALNHKTCLLERCSTAPLLDRHGVDPFSISYPCVLNSGGRYEMWYGSNLSWGPRADDMQHVIKHASSADGISWHRDGAICIPLCGEEYAISKPCVLMRGAGYQMWYSYRGKSYRLGYAESSDGINWRRMDNHVGITPSEFGWDSEMICYAHVFDHAGQRMMIYNGNGYGRTGFGLAVLVEDG